MAQITKVVVTDHKIFSGKAVWVYYKNKNRYRNDRARLFPSIPKTAEKFIQTAKNKKVYDCLTYTSTEYTN